MKLFKKRTGTTFILFLLKLLIYLNLWRSVGLTEKGRNYLYIYYYIGGELESTFIHIRV